MNFINDLYFLTLKSYLLDEKERIELEGGDITIKAIYDAKLQYPTAMFVSTIHNAEGKSLFTHFFAKPSDISVCELLGESIETKLKFIFKKNFPLFGRKFSGRSIINPNLDCANEKELSNLKKQISHISDVEYHDLVGIQHKSKKLNRTQE